MRRTTKKVEAAKRGYARGDADAVTRLLAVLALDDEAVRQRALDELARERQETAQRFVEESLRRLRERRAALVAAADAASGPGAPERTAGAAERTTGAAERTTKRAASS
jgi:hypothetical protein